MSHYDEDPDDYDDGCVDESPDDPCTGPVEHRAALSGSGRSFRRCDGHWDRRLAREDEITARYPDQRPADFDPAYAGERWEEDD